MTTTLLLRRPDDFHVHFREGDMLRLVAPWTARDFARALVMPNTKTPIRTGDEAVDYWNNIRAACQSVTFQPLMTIKVGTWTTPEIVMGAKALGVIAGKVYPAGVTTNSEDGAHLIDELFPAFDAMEKAGMVLCLHGEEPSAFCLDREAAFLATLRRIVTLFPRLRVVLEHVTTRAAVEAVMGLPDTVAATITVHHLFLTLDDVVGEALHPHHFCKPLAKRPDDRDAVRAAALSGHPRFFLGTDSAPHSQENKECASGCAGIFTAPVALPLLAEVFEEAGKLHLMEGFTSEYGARHYCLPLNEGRITLSRQSPTGRPTIGGQGSPSIVVFRGDSPGPWRRV